MNSSDHDLLIKLDSRVDSLQSSHRDFSGQILTEISKMSTKIDGLRDAQTLQDNRIRDLESKSKSLENALKDQDLRIATLEQQVDTLRDIAKTQTATNEAIQSAAAKRDKEYESRTKRVAFVVSLITFGVSMTPKIIEWLRLLLVTLYANPVPIVQAAEVTRYILGMYFGIFL